MQPETFTIESICRGMAPSLPADAKAELKHKYLQNIRITSDGEIESRPRISSYLSLTESIDLVHSLRKIVHKASGNKNFIAGVGTKIFTGAASPLTQKVIGLSGKPIAIVNFRPEEAIETYAYIADENKMMKISANDILADIGIDPPTSPITFNVEAAARKILDNITNTTLADWTVTNGTKTIVGRVNTTVDRFIPDGTLPNFASVIPASFSSEIQAGEILLINGQERIVEEIISTGLAAGVATIAAINYDAGTTGACHITLSTPVTDIYRNSIILLGGTEYARVLEVTRGNNGVPVIKTSTVATFAVGNIIQGLASFRVFTDTTYNNGDVIFAEGLKDSITAAGVSNLTKIANYDLTNAGGEALSENALFHISLKSSSPSDLVEIQIQLGFDTNFVDYIYYSVSPNFLTSNITQQASAPTALQAALQRRALIAARVSRYSNARYGDIELPYGLDDFSELYETTLTETALGSDIWTEIAVPFSSFTRVGSDSSKSRKDIKAIRISINAKAATDISIDSIWVGGASGLDSTKGVEEVLFPYNYVWRFRDPTTKSVSNWSPPLREGIKIRRQAVTLKFSANTNPNTWKIDIARIGGTLNDFRILASILNNGSSFTDDISDDLIADNERAARNSSEFSIGDFDYFKPFAVLDTPKSGTCNVVGTELEILTGDHLDLSYPRGTKILVSGQLTQFYSNPYSPTRVSLEKNLDTLANVAWEIREPLLTGKPLPILAGPFGEGFEGLVLFGAGDKNAPGTVYWLDPNSPDTMSDINKLEITSPTEPIMNIVMYDNNAIVYTNKRSFTMRATISNGILTFAAPENANSKGIFSRNGICVARTFIYQLCDDGVYRSEGIGNPQSITDGDLHSLFPHNGKEPGLLTALGAIIYPPDFTKPEEMRLYSTEDHVFWRFIDKNNKQACLVYDTRLEGWISWDRYLDDKVGVVYKDEEEGALDIFVGQAGAVGRFRDVSSPEDTLESIFTTFSMDVNNPRLLKQFYEVGIDAENIGGAKLSIGFNSNSIIIPDDTILSIIGFRDIDFTNIINGLGQSARNIATSLKWTLASGTRVYRELISYTPLADLITDRFSDFEPDDIRDRFWQGVMIEADTLGQDKIIKYYDSIGIERASIRINHNGRMTRLYTFDVPFFSHRIRRGSMDGISWIPYREDYKFDEEFDDRERYFNGISLDIDTGGIDRILNIYDNNHTLVASLNVNHDGRYIEEFSFDTPFKSFTARKEFAAILGLTKLRLYSEEYRISEYVDDIGNNVPKWFNGVVIDVDTFGEDKTFYFYDNDIILRNTITINHNGKKAEFYSFDVPFLSENVIRKSMDGIRFILYDIKYDYRVDVDNIEDNKPKWIQGVLLDVSTFGEDKEFRFYDDEAIMRASILINHSERKTVLYTFDKPFLTNNIIRKSIDSIRFSLYNETYIMDEEFDDRERYYNGISLDIDTGGINRVLTLRDGNLDIVAIINVNHNGRYVEEFSFDVPFKAFSARKEFIPITGRTKLALYSEEYRISNYVDDIDNASPKWFNGVVLDIDTFGEDKEFRFYDDLGSLRDIITINHNGRQAQLYSFDLPFLSNKIIRQSNDNVRFVLYSAVYDYRASVDNIEDDKAKFWQGTTLDLNTFGQDKEFHYYNDEGVLKASLVINHNGRKSKSYSFDLPFISNKIYRQSTDGIIFALYKEEYVYDKESELVSVWESQSTSHGIEGFKQIKLPAIAIASTGDVEVEFILDTEVISKIIPSTNGVKKINRFHIPARKFELIKYRLVSDVPFRNYKKDTEILIRRFNGQEDFQVIKPFGALDDETQVQI